MATEDLRNTFSNSSISAQFSKISEPTMDASLIFEYTANQNRTEIEAFFTKYCKHEVILIENVAPSEVGADMAFSEGSVNLPSTWNVVMCQDKEDQIIAVGELRKIVTHAVELPPLSFTDVTVKLHPYLQDITSNQDNINHLWNQCGLRAYLGDTTLSGKWLQINKAYEILKPVLKAKHKLHEEARNIRLGATQFQPDEHRIELQRETNMVNKQIENIFSTGTPDPQPDTVQLQNIDPGDPETFDLHQSSTGTFVLHHLSQSEARDTQSENCQHSNEFTQRPIMDMDVDSLGVHLSYKKETEQTNNGHSVGVDEIDRGSNSNQEEIIDEKTHDNAGRTTDSTCDITEQTEGVDSIVANNRYATDTKQTTDTASIPLATTPSFTDTVTIATTDPRSTDSSVAETESKDPVGLPHVHDYDEDNIDKDPVPHIQHNDIAQHIQHEDPVQYDGKGNIINEATRNSGQKHKTTEKAVRERIEMVRIIWIYIKKIYLKSLKELEKEYSVTVHVVLEKKMETIVVAIESITGDQQCAMEAKLKLRNLYEKCEKKLSCKEVTEDVFCVARQTQNVACHQSDDDRYILIGEEQDVKNLIKGMIGPGITHGRLSRSEENDVSPHNNEIMLTDTGKKQRDPDDSCVSNQPDDVKHFKSEDDIFDEKEDSSSDIKERVIPDQIEHGDSEAGEEIGAPSTTIDQGNKHTYRLKWINWMYMSNTYESNIKKICNNYGVKLHVIRNTDMVCLSVTSDINDITYVSKTIQLLKDMNDSCESNVVSHELPTDILNSCRETEQLQNIVTYDMRDGRAVAVGYVEDIQELTKIQRSFEEKSEKSWDNRQINQKSCGEGQEKSYQNSSENFKEVSQSERGWENSNDRVNKDRPNSGWSTTDKKVNVRSTNKKTDGMDSSSSTYNKTTPTPQDRQEDIKRKILDIATNYDKDGEYGDDEDDDRDEDTSSHHGTSQTDMSRISISSFCQAYKHGVNQQQIIIWEKNITEICVDVIVNASNERLSFEKGVSKAIAEAAGRELLDDCQRIKAQGKLRVTEAVYTKAGNLSCKQVLHAVGPKWDVTNPERTEAELIATIGRCLEKAVNAGHNSIAIPAISSGIYGTPPSIVGRAIFTAIDCSMKMKSTLKIIFLIDINKDALQVISNTFKSRGVYEAISDDEAKKIFVTATSPIVSGPSRSFQTDAIKATKATNPPTHRSNKVGIEFWHSINGQCIVIGKTDITKVQVDVIVSAANMHLTNVTGVAKALSDAAGPELNRECSKLSRYQTYNVKNVIATPPGRLPCKEVYHAVGPVYASSYTGYTPPHERNRPSPHERDLCDTIANCLNKADRMGYASIAIPAISSGAVGIPAEIFARVIHKTISDFCRIKTSLESVYIIDINDKIIQAVYGEFTSSSNFSASFVTTNHGLLDDYGNYKQQEKANVNSRLWYDDKQADATTSKESKEMSRPGNQLVKKQQTTESCPICMDNITKPKVLKCKHVFCDDCWSKAFKVKPVCPVCGTSYGVVTGTQPKNGTMHSQTRRSSLSGHSGCGSIVIYYTFPSGTQGSEHPHPGTRYNGMTRTAYLPNNKEGQHILKLLKKAFEARLVFTIGQSVTTGRQGQITWNDIHHKTSMYGGATGFGYPDDTYLKRVQDELAAKGIK